MLSQNFLSQKSSKFQNLARPPHQHQNLQRMTTPNQNRQNFKTQPTVSKKPSGHPYICFQATLKQMKMKMNKSIENWLLKKHLNMNEIYKFDDGVLCFGNKLDATPQNSTCLVVGFSILFCIASHPFQGFFCLFR